MDRTPQIKLENDEIEQMTLFKYLRCLVRENMLCGQEVKRTIALSKEALNGKKRLWSRPLDTKLRKTMVKCFVWSLLLHGAATWTLRLDIEKRIGEEVTGLRDVDMEKDGRYFLEG